MSSVTMWARCIIARIITLGYISFGISTSESGGGQYMGKLCRCVAMPVYSVTHMSTVCRIMQHHPTSSTYMESFMVSIHSIMVSCKFTLYTLYTISG